MNDDDEDVDDAREESIEDYAESLGIDYDDAEALFDEIGGDPDSWDVPLGDDGRPDADYMLDLADELDCDVSDLYDMFYGYAPGESE